MNWWGWVIGGAILLGAELTLISAEFYLVVVGAAAIATGVLCLSIPGLVDWAQWALFAVLSLTLLAGFRARLYGRLMGHAPGVKSGPVGGALNLPRSLAPGETCQAEHAGSYWTVRNDSDGAIAAGAPVRVTGVRGLTLQVRPE
jgi:membrane protein implicated in regulation of membrane protease activity